MGGEGGHGKKPGAANAVDVASTYDAGSLAGKGNITDTWNQGVAPGKRTLTGDPNRPTGDAYMDGQAACDTKRPDCFLTDTQRSRIIGTYQDRVNAAFTAFVDALSAIGVEKLMEKGDSDLPWMMSLLFDCIGAHALSTLTSALTALRNAEVSNLERIVVLDAGGERMGSHAASVMHQ